MGPNPASIKDLERIIQKLFNLALPIGGMIAFVMLLVGGFKYLFSSGDPQKIESARKTLTFAIIGLIIALGAIFIFELIGSLTGTSDLLFNFSITSTSPPPKIN